MKNTDKQEGLSAHIAPGGCYHGDIFPPDPASKPVGSRKVPWWVFVVLLILVLVPFVGRLLR